jgi:hypothetical protein
MPKQEHLKILKQGIAAWNEWRILASYIKPNLSLANLSRADLRGANLRGAILSRADLREAKLTSADLREANLTYANLNEADLQAADLRGAEICATRLRGADLRKANLSGANFSGADILNANLTMASLKDSHLANANFTNVVLAGADLSRARIAGTTFANNDLSEVIGLDSVRHLGPSTIGIDTLYKSNAKIPEEFLRGCGVPDGFITMTPSLVGALEAIQFYSCFISYSSKDKDFTERLFSRMRYEHLRVWFAPENIKSGHKIHEQIEEAIRYYDKLLVVLSENSMQSEWVMTEIRNARQAEIRGNRRKLFPIRLVDFDTIRQWKCFDADTGKDLAIEVREYFIPDFSNWKDHDSFEAGFKKLLDDLRTAESKFR